MCPCCRCQFLSLLYTPSVPFTQILPSAGHHACYCSVKKKNPPLSASSIFTPSASLYDQTALSCLYLLSLFSQLLLNSQPVPVPSRTILSDITEEVDPLPLETLLWNSLFIFLLSSFCCSWPSWQTRSLLSVGVRRARPQALLMSHSVAVTHRLQPASQSLEGLSVYKLKDPILRVSDSRSPGWGLGICISVKSQVVSRLLIQTPHFENQCSIALQAFQPYLWL